MLGVQCHFAYGLVAAVARSWYRGPGYRPRRAIAVAMLQLPLDRAGGSGCNASAEKFLKFSDNLGLPVVFVSFVASENV